jgi:capsid protein
LEGKQEVHFSEFYDTNMKVIFAALGIPMEIALMLFGSNYSASRASIKDWEHTLNVKRIKNVSPAYRHIYNIFLVTQVLSGNVSAPGYVEAVMAKNSKRTWVLLAYQSTRWIGANPPNIDELKEVTAARLKAGAGSAHMPFDSMANIAQDLGLRGDYIHTMDEYQKEVQYADKIGIEKVELARQNIEEFGNSNEDSPGKKDAKPTKKNQDLPPDEEDAAPAEKPKKKATKKK